MKEINDSESFNAADIARYLNGEMTPAEMYAIEKAALEDPFLADAIDGFNTDIKTSSGAVNLEHLADLNKRLNERTSEEKKVISAPRHYWLRIAAGIMLLAGTAGLTYVLMNASEEKQQVAKVENKALVDPDSMSLAEAKAEQADTSAAAADQTSVSALKKEIDNPRASTSHTESSSDALTQSTAREKIKNETAPPVQKEKSVANVLAGKVAGVNVGAQRPTPSSQGRIEEVHNKDRAENVSAPFSGNKFTGVVVNTDNQPIIGASVIVNNRNLAVSTDKEGNFNVMMPDTSIKLTIESVGYETANVTLRNNFRDNRIVLNSSAALNEVVVTAYGKEKRQRTSTSSRITNGEPEGGWMSYENYISKNKRIPRADSSIHGEVLISFSVNKKGKPTNLKVEQSLSRLLDAEAKRLLIQGPAWKPLQGERRASVSISF